MLTLLKGGNVYAPHPLGTKDILLAGNRIAAIDDDLETGGNLPVTVVDASGLLVTPGLVDSLVHITGGGGEGGFTTRTPEMQLTDATRGGVTTVIGVLGTDATTRTLANLLAKARALEEEGISSYCHTGSYQYPVRTLTGSVTDDLLLIDKFIGVGEVAIADHRASHMTVDELTRLAAEARVGGMLSGSAGIVSIHTGDGKACLALLHQVAEHSEIPLTQFYPTHVNRNPDLFEAGLAFARKGGTIDFTTSTNAHILSEGEVDSPLALARALEAGIAPTQMTFSSDGNASLPVFDREGRLQSLEVGEVASLFDAIRRAITEQGVGIEHALMAGTLNPARILALPHKGRLQVGADADVLLVNPDGFILDSVFAKGQAMVRGGQIRVKGTFE